MVTGYLIDRDLSSFIKTYGCCILQIVSGGNIILSDSFFMTARQKTFALALSRDMTPSARILVYTLYNGEVLADSLSFAVRGIRGNGVSLLK